MSLGAHSPAGLGVGQSGLHQFGYAGIVVEVIASALSTPQWPCGVDEHRQTSVASQMSRPKRAFNARTWPAVNDQSIWRSARARGTPNSRNFVTPDLRSCSTWRSSESVLSWCTR